MTPISVRNIPSANSAVHEGISILLPDVIQIYFNPSMEECVLRFLSKRGGSDCII
ncbi:hypothetical protein [Parabacteroides johnsonii]|jgi:hypothetical protein|uniref:Uncharacterized protein n=2 Tax=Parabacteroides johnsonii TaxID=387661 RepID=K5XZZ3_9BACT|nr:hypothetical protein [Parabacteroides johnsonii]EKN06322.1 hypothetical protein HMPREF1077_03345 [Parabacteroides johnsonii CL02T12C29]CCX76389.1 unknown [Parabacteroides johnsonii CAG:246]